MNLRLSAIDDRGDLFNERIGIEVINSCQIKRYILFQTTFSEKGFYNRSQNSYWFTPLDVNKGDRIIVYTKIGVDAIKTNNDGTTSYFFYWGLNESLFINDNKIAVLVQVNTWVTSEE